MAGPPTSADAVVTLVFGGDNLPLGAVSTLGVSSLGDPNDWEDTLPALVPLFEAFHSASSAQFTNLSSVELKVGPSDSGPTFIASASASGSQGTGAPSPQVSYLIRKQVTGLSARFGGRMFYPPCGETLISPGGIIQGSVLSATQEALDDLRDGLTALGVSLAVFGAARGTVPAKRDVSRLVLEAQVATQRRRNRK